MLDMLRPALELPYERGAVDILGTVLWAVIVGRLKLPSGGRGTDRDGDAEDVTAPDLALAPAEGPENDLTPLCGGRGTERPAGAGSDLELVGCPARLAVGAAALRAVGVPVLCEAATAGDGVDELLGGVILLTVGREAAAADGCAAGRPAFGPSMLARVGDTFGRPILALDRFRKPLLGTLTAFA